MNPEAHFGSTGQVRNIRERCLLLLCPRNSPVTPPPRYGVEINKLPLPFGWGFVNSQIGSI